jgi:hypothetical protein
MKRTRSIDRYTIQKIVVTKELRPRVIQEDAVIFKCIRDPVSVGISPLQARTSRK